MLIKCVEGESTQGGGSQEYASTLAAHLIIVYFSFRLVIFFYKPHACATIHDNGMGKCKGKTE